MVARRRRRSPTNSTGWPILCAFCKGWVIRATREPLFSPPLRNCLKTLAIVKTSSFRPETRGFIARRSGEIPAFRFCSCRLASRQLFGLQVLKQILRTCPGTMERVVISTGTVRSHRTVKWRNPRISSLLLVSYPTQILLSLVSGQIQNTRLFASENKP